MLHKSKMHNGGRRDYGGTRKTVFLSFSSLVLLSHSSPAWMFDRRRENKVLRTISCPKHHVLLFSIIFEVFFSSYSSSCQFLTMNSVVIQCGCSSECCMHNTTDGSNTSMSHRANHCVLFWQRSISGCFKYSEIKELPCIQLCVCVCAHICPVWRCASVHVCRWWCVLESVCELVSELFMRFKVLLCEKCNATRF